MDPLPILLATIYAALTGLSIVTDRVILSDVLEQPGTKLFTGRTSTFIMAIAVQLGVAINYSPSLKLLGLFFLFALFKTVPTYGYLRLIKNADASTVSPIISTQPVLTVIFAYILLGELLAPIEYASVVLIIVGIILMTLAGLRDSVLTGTTVFNHNALAATGLAFVWSFEAIVAKYTLGLTDFWTMFFWSSMFSAGLVLLFLNADVREEVKSIFTGMSSNKVGAIGMGEFIGSVGAISLYAAYDFGPVSAVAPVIHTYSVFVFLYIIILHLSGFSIDTKITGKEMKKKAIATVFTLTGIAILTIV